MSKTIVDYENLIESSFTSDSSLIRTSVRPRWERKKAAQQMSSLMGGSTPATITTTTTSTLEQTAGEGFHRVRPPLMTSTNNGDRYIPNRASMNMDLCKHLVSRGNIPEAEEDTSFTAMVTDRESSAENANIALNNSNVESSISNAKKKCYHSNLSSALLGVDDLKGNRVISYQEKAPAPKGDSISNLNVLYSANDYMIAKKKNTSMLVTRQISSTPSRILDAPDLMDDYYLNLLSWSDTNILAVALSQTVYLWNAETGVIQELCTFDQNPSSYVSSVSWVQQGGAHIAVGTSNGTTQLWDVHESKQLRSMDGHNDRVNALAWNTYLLGSGGRDCRIVNHDVRAARHNVGTLCNHTQEVCSLAWSPDGEMLASGGNDNLICLWDASSAFSSSVVPRFVMTEHQAAVKALAWSPHEKNLLASGGGTADRCIKFWNSKTGSLVNSIDTGSQVCALQWNPFEKEILSSHGYARNQLSLWKYPTMAKIKDLEGHQSRVLHMAMSPDGSTVVSAAADETLRFWNVFSPPPLPAKRDMTFLSSSSSKSRWTTTIR